MFEKNQGKQRIFSNNKRIFLQNKTISKTILKCFVFFFGGPGTECFKSIQINIFKNILDNKKNILQKILK